MNKRPLSVTLISCLFIAAGVVGIVYHAAELKELTTQRAVIWVIAVRLLAIAGGFFSLNGANWARWLLLAWIIFHVIISIFHTTAELAMHTIVMIVVILALFHPKANAYFKRK
jgi:hypothetical protein